MTMRKNSEKSVSFLKSSELPPRLLEAIMARIETEKRRRAKMRLVLFSSVMAFSILGFIPAYKLFVNEFYTSGLNIFLWLIFSDSQIALRYWQDFLLSTLELMPVASMSAALTILAAFLGSLRASLTEVKNAFAAA